MIFRYPHRAHVSTVRERERSDLIKTRMETESSSKCCKEEWNSIPTRSFCTFSLLSSHYSAQPLTGHRRRLRLCNGSSHFNWSVLIPLQESESEQECARAQSAVAVSSKSSVIKHRSVKREYVSIWLEMEQMTQSSTTYKLLPGSLIICVHAVKLHLCEMRREKISNKIWNESFFAIYFRWLKLTLRRNTPLSRVESRLLLLLRLVHACELT